VALEWLKKYDADNTASVTDLVNCVLKSTGCGIKVTEDDINDPDNVPGRLADIQEEYKDVSSPFYMLNISIY
jgi:cohesin complex subunit SA-1/2